MDSGEVDILCLSTWSVLGGAQGNAVRLAEAFRARGYKATVGFLIDQRPKQCYEVEGSFFVATAAPKNPFQLWKFLADCRREIRTRRPKITIGFHPLAINVGAIFAGTGGKFISRQAWPNYEESWLSHLLQYFLIKTPLIHANIAVSKFISSTYEARGNSYRRKTSVVYNNAPVLPFLAESREQARQVLGIKAGSPIGAIGRLHRQKNFQLAIQAVQQCADRHLYIAGEGGEASSLRALAKSLGVDERVHFLGPLRGLDVSRFYRAIDLLLMPSLFEGHPMVMLEAMAAGTPVLASDISVMREAGGDAARYAGSDPDDWARAITDIKTDELESMSVHGVQRANSFAKISMVDEYLRIAGLPLRKNRE